MLTIFILGLCIGFLVGVRLEHMRFHRQVSHLLKKEQDGYI